jgi:hypothetical protein
MYLSLTHNLSSILTGRLKEVYLKKKLKGLLSLSSILLLPPKLLPANLFVILGKINLPSQNHGSKTL